MAWNYQTFAFTLAYFAVIGKRGIFVATRKQCQTPANTREHRQTPTLANIGRCYQSRLDMHTDVCWQRKVKRGERPGHRRPSVGRSSVACRKGEGSEAAVRIGCVVAWLRGCVVARLPLPAVATLGDAFPGRPVVGAIPAAGLARKRNSVPGWKPLRVATLPG